MAEPKPKPERRAVDVSIPLTSAAGKNIEENMERSMDKPMYFMNRRTLEKSLLSIICSGNPYLLEGYLTHDLPLYSQVVVGTMAKEKVTQQRYLCVVIISLICRAVIDAGVPEQIAFSLSDSFIQQVNTLHRPEQLTELSVQVIRLYCQAVQDYRMERVSAPVRKCCEYMMVKLHSAITLQELSQVCSLSPNYISDLFRKELGISALQYFHQQKLQYARHLVLHSDWSIATIAAQLSYPSQSNFTERFKKAYGMTPMRFRMEHAHSDGMDLP